MSEPWWKALFSAMAGAWTSQRLEDAGATPAAAAAAPTVFTSLPSGYSTDADRAARAHQLHQLQLEAVNRPEWRAQPDGRTFCNRASAFIAQGMGYFNFPPGALANFMITRMAADAAWREEHDLKRAHVHAERGGLTFATLIDYPHGHLCSFSPEPMQYSSTWMDWVPMVANVGPTNGIMRLSGAFRVHERPSLRYYLLHPEAV